MSITTTYDPSRPAETWKAILVEFLSDTFPASEVHVTFSPLNLKADWPKEKLIQIIPLSPSVERRYKVQKGEELKIVHKEEMEGNIAILCKNPSDADNLSDRLQETVNNDTAVLGAAGLRDAYISSPIDDPFLLGTIVVYRHIHRICFQIETY